MDLGEKIKQRREDMGLTMEDLGDRVGVAKSTIMKWEHGDIAHMRMDKITALAKALGVSPLWVLGMEPQGAAPDTQAMLSLYEGATDKGRHMAFGVLLSNQKGDEGESP